MLSASNLDDHFVEVPTRTGARTATTEIARNQSAELQEPASNRLVRNIDPALGQQVLDVTERQSESGVKPNGMLDYLGRKTMTLKRNWCHTVTVPASLVAGHRLNVSMPTTFRT